MSEPRTVLVIGINRSGTSIVSGILHHLGCNMNPHPNPSVIAPRSTFEDKQLHGWCEAVSHTELTDDCPHIKRLEAYIAKRNENHVWGFKSGRMFDVLEHILPRVRNPRIVWVWRDPLHSAISAQTLTQYHADAGAEKYIGMAKMRLAGHLQMRMHRLNVMANALVKHEKVPHIHVSFQDIRDHFEQVVGKLSAFAGTKITSESMALIEKMYIKGYCSWGKRRGDSIP